MVPRPPKMALAVVLLLFQAAHFVSGESTKDFIVPPANLAQSPYPEWAHYHMVWLDNGRANQASMIEYTKEYLKYDIPVGGVDIDSSWSTGFNNFIFNKEKYPNASEMIAWFHSSEIRVILWATSMIDTNSPNFKEALDNGYFIRDIFGKAAMLKWWHGTGGLLDYTNKDAVDWWHKQLDNVIDLGIDGWKCDGTDPYILEVFDAQGTSDHVSRKQYSDMYYNDFFFYIRSKRGANDSLIWSRPVDGYGPIYLDFSPRDVMYSGWVGDQDPTFEGLQEALKRYLQSAWAGYANFGSDIGGYRSGNGTLGRTKELFIRWFQLGAFSPLMENGGNKEHRPWMFDNTNQTLNIYKKFVDTHYKLVPYFLTIGAFAMEHGTSAITPLAKHEDFIDKLIDLFKPDTYNYLLGDNILVAPVTAEPSQVRVDFPVGSKWVAEWNESLVYQGGQMAQFNNLPLEIFPVFIKTNAFLPLRVTPLTDYLGEVPLFRDAIRFQLLYPEWTEKPVVTHLREEQGVGMIASHQMDAKGFLHVTVTAHSELNVIIHVIGCKADTALLHDASNVRELPQVTTVNKLHRGGVYIPRRGVVVVYLGAVLKGAHLILQC